MPIMWVGWGSLCEGVGVQVCGCESTRVRLSLYIYVNIMCSIYISVCVRACVRACVCVCVFILVVYILICATLQLRT